ncbi:MAG TPA: hypothetical protein VMV92_04380 [Streptosporangiaceae bacterium]|nr:hypothetical protein [Streptosporangiaceae bacterium]
MKLTFLIVSRVMSLLRLSRREAWWKDAEILILRHQLAVAKRERPPVHARLTWPDRAWLVLLAGTLPIEHLAGMRLIVTPGTIVRWQRDIVRRRWARLSRQSRSGRPATHRNVRSVVLRLARENESWGYRRIHGELAGLGITVAPSTVWQILKSAGIEPAPRRNGPGWAEFLRSQAQGILALDFFTADLLNGAKVYVLAVIEHGTRRIRILGATEHPAQSWVVQQTRNLARRQPGQRSPRPHDRRSSRHQPCPSPARGPGPAGTGTHLHIGQRGLTCGTGSATPVSATVSRVRADTPSTRTPSTRLIVLRGNSGSGKSSVGARQGAGKCRELTGRTAAYEQTTSKHGDH